jgi:acyl dehydratase
LGGKFYEELEVGRIFEHQTARTVHEYDNILFSTLTMNPQPLHLDSEFASKTEFGKPLVNSLFTLGLAVGLSVEDTTLGTTVGNLGFQNIEFPRPVFGGDTIHTVTEVKSKRESKSRPTQGIVVLEHRAINQRGEVIMRCQRIALMHKRPHEN